MLELYESISNKVNKKHLRLLSKSTLYIHIDAHTTEHILEQMLVLVGTGVCFDHLPCSCASPSKRRFLKKLNTVTLYHKSAFISKFYTPSVV